MGSAGASVGSWAGSAVGSGSSFLDVLIIRTVASSDVSESVTKPSLISTSYSKVSFNATGVPSAVTSVTYSFISSPPTGTVTSVFAVAVDSPSITSGTMFWLTPSASCVQSSSLKIPA